MLENTYPSRRVLHNFPAIIPLDGQMLDHNYPIHPAFLALSPEYKAIEKSIYECCLLDVSSIWIACPPTIEPHLRTLVGNWACTIEKDPTEKNKHRAIPIFLVPTSIDDQRKRNSFVWSIISVAETIIKTYSTVSDWLYPKNFYVSFPYGIFDFSKCMNRRGFIKKEPYFAFRHKGQTIADGEKLSFSFDIEYLKIMKRRWKDITISVRAKEGIPNSMGLLPKLPRPERWTGRWLELKDMFYDFPIDKANIFDVEWFYDISSWNGYRKFLASEYADTIQKPSFQRWGMKYGANTIKNMPDE